MHAANCARSRGQSITRYNRRTKMATDTKAALITVILCVTFISGVLSENSTCSSRNSSCTDCTDGKKDCYWCDASKECLKWPGSLHSNDIHCKGYRYYYNQCRLNGVGIIAITVVSVVLLMGLCLCCCICCCCYCMSQRRKRSYEALRETHEYTNRNIASQNSERKAERAARREEIVRKYQRGSSKYDQLA